jgi:DNA polymerase bacteriophage-type
MTTLWLDLETYSETPITHGTHKYAENAEVLLVAYAFDDEPVEVMDLTERSSLDSVQMMIDTADKIVIHNSAFDRTVLRHCGVHIPTEKVEDTMVLALAHGLPGSLGTLCDVMGVPQDKAKDKAGKKLIHLFTKPRPKNVKLRRATRDTHPEEWAAFIEYARLDVDAMRVLYRLLPNWNNHGGERLLWLLDQKINDRGIAIDVELADAALRAFQRSTRSLAERTRILTNGAVGSLTQRDKFMKHLENTLGFTTPDLKKGTVSNLLLGDICGEVRELLEIRQQASATSPAKYNVLLKATSADGRLRGTLQFCGASRTGRWGGRLFQPQNLPRPTLKQEQIDMGIDAMKLDCEDLLFDNVAELCSSAVRGALIVCAGGANWSSLTCPTSRAACSRGSPARTGRPKRLSSSTHGVGH